MPGAGASSSSEELWKPQQQQPPAPPHPPSSAPPSDPWFLHTAQRDTQILTQALSRELRSPKEPSPDLHASSPKSLAQTLSHCLSGRGAWHSDSPNSAAVIRALQQQSGAFLHQRQQQQQQQQQQLPQPQVESSNLSNSPSPMSTSDLKDRLSQPGSPFNSSCATSMVASGDGKPQLSMGATSMVASGDGKPQLSMDTRGFKPQPQEGEDVKVGPFGNSLSSLLTSGNAASQVKVEEGQGIASWARTAPSALSAQAAVGAGASKVSKRRSRATSKAPITVLSADTQNFRAMVQKLTGIPASPSMQRNRFHLWSTPNGVSVLKPHPTRPSQSIQGLPTLDTSAYLLLDGAPTLGQAPRLLQNDNLLQSFPGLSFLQSSQPQTDASFNANLVAELGLNRGIGQLNQTSFPPGTNPDLKSLLLEPFKQGNPSNPSASCISMPTLWDLTEGHNADKLREKCFPDKLRDGCFSDRMEEGFNGRGENSRHVLSQGMVGGGIEANQFNMRHSTNLESLLLGSERLDFDFSGRTLNTVDSWLSCDGALGNHAPKLELARSA